ncbi:MAG: hypothetical protein ACE5HU_05145, partial [Acidobacteriota bacterium]
MKHTTLAVLGFWAIALVGPAITVSEASSSRTWVLRDLKSDEDVMLDGVALTADGGIRLSARVIPIFDAAQPNLWCLARDARGRIYAGSGNDGKVFRIDPDGGNPEVIFDSDELEVHAIAFDADDRLYVATSPDGAVFRITPEGMPVMIFDPSETYIWAMVLDDHDRLYVATGHPGRVYRVDHLEPNASGVVVLDGHEENIRTLIRDEKGTLYAGSDQSGIVYRITPPDKTSVIYDSPMREIAAIAVAPGADGEERLYIATLAPLPRRAASSGETPGTGDVTHVQITAEGPDNGEKGEGSEEQQRRRRAARRPTPDRYFGAIYELTTRGYARRLWQSTDALPLSLARLSPQGDGWGEGVLVGTGSAGRVLLVRASGDASEYVTIPSQQVNALIPDGHGAFYAAASNLGQVVRISPGAADSGTVTSPVHDAGFTSTWGTISWTADEPGGAAVTLQVRTGDTEKPDDSWSAWSSAYTDATGEAIRRPHARFVQWRAKLAAGRAGVSPV